MIGHAILTVSVTHGLGHAILIVSVIHRLDESRYVNYHSSAKSRYIKGSSEINFGRIVTLLECKRTWRLEKPFVQNAA